MPQIAQRAGFYFVNFDTDAIPLDDYLADAGPMLDAIADQSAVGMEVVRGCHEYEIKANYKLICENSYDGYHLDLTHSSYVDYMRTMMQGISDLGDEHSWRRAQSRQRARLLRAARFRRDGRSRSGCRSGAKRRGSRSKPRNSELEARLGKARADRIAVTNRNMVIFPNSIINDQQTVLLRTVTPTAHNRMIIRAWSIGPVDEGPVLRRIRNEGALSFLGPGGFATPDDVEMLELCQRGFETSDVEWNDISKGFRPDENTLRDDDEHFDNELQMRAYWLRWDQLMSAPERRA